MPSSTEVATAAEAELRDSIGTLLTFRRTATAMAQVKATPALLLEIAQIDSIIDAAKPMMSELPDEADARQIALVRSIGALRRLLL
jgi:hypothetical protein